MSASDPARMLLDLEAWLGATRDRSLLIETYVDARGKRAYFEVTLYERDGSVASSATDSDMVNAMRMAVVRALRRAR